MNRTFGLMTLLGLHVSVSLGLTPSAYGEISSISSASPTTSPVATPAKWTPRPYTTRVPNAPSSKPMMPAIGPNWPYPRVPEPVVARQGAVASVSGVASEVGVRILRQGGNAVDASVAVALALAVVFPEAGNIGGGGFMLVRTSRGELTSLDFREVAPLAASPDMYLDKQGNVTPASQKGHRAVGVPGTVAGLVEAHRRYGQLPWASLVRPAITLARDGFEVSPYLSRSMARAQDLLMRCAETRRVFMPEDQVPRAGSILKQPDLARTLEAIAKEGQQGFYGGRVAALLVKDQVRHGGIITLADFQRYRPRWREPLTFHYRGWRVVSMAPPSSGGATLAQMLNILEGVDLKGLSWHTPAHIHWLTEAERRAYTDRNAYLADPDFVRHQPLDTLISKDYAAKRRATINPERATPQFGREPGLGAPEKLVPAIQESEQTTHFSIMDARGGAVSCTYTLNGNFGAGVVAEGTGILLNNEMDDFAVKPGAPNLFGLVQGKLNAIRPGKRMLSSMTPVLVFDASGKLRLVLGSPGGSTIPTTVMQVVSSVVDFGWTLAQAIAAPRLHHQGLPDIIYYEPHGLASDCRDGLVRLGHAVKQREPIGDATGVWVRDDGRLEAFADPRRGGQAAGY